MLSVGSFLLGVGGVCTYLDVNSVITLNELIFQGARIRCSHEGNIAEKDSMDPRILLVLLKAIIVLNSQES